MVYREQGKYNRAERLFQHAVEGATKQLGLTHPNTQRYVANFADLYSRWGKPEKAQPLLLQQLAVIKDKDGADSPLTATTMAQLASNLLLQKKHAEAENLFRECLRVREKVQPDVWTTFNTKSMLGEALAGQKKYADAEPLLVQGYEGMLKRQDKIPVQFRTVRLKEALERLVSHYDTTSDKGKAAKYRQELDALTKPAKEPPKK
jgi:tetratricopeptide (TPR) repeat protein